MINFDIFSLQFKDQYFSPLSTNTKQPMQHNGLLLLVTSSHCFVGITDFCNPNYLSVTCCVCVPVRVRISYIPCNNNLSNGTLSVSTIRSVDSFYMMALNVSVSSACISVYFFNQPTPIIKIIVYIRLIFCFCCAFCSLFSGPQ